MKVKLVIFSMAIIGVFASCEETDQVDTTTPNSDSLTTLVVDTNAVPIAQIDSLTAEVKDSIQ